MGSTGDPLMLVSVCIQVYSTQASFALLYEHVFMYMIMCLCIFKLEDNCFILLCYFLMMSQTQIYMAPPPEALPTPTHPIPPSRMSQSTGWSSLCHTANSHVLAVSPVCFMLYSQLSHTLLPLCYKPDLLSASPPLVLHSSVPSF